ncbi:hypothetical protein GCM10020219_023210 [Nonomuraea dietziae]
MSSEPLVVVEGLRKVYRSGPKEVVALREVSFEAYPGELVAIRGRSGSGKTTLLNQIGGLDRPDAGRVVVAGQEVTSLPEEALLALRRDVVGFVFQSFGLIPVLSAAENVGVPMRLARTPVEEREKRVRMLLSLVGLEQHLNQRPYELSGGQRQRVAIARSLANRPRLLVADEPTGQLDSQTGRQIMQLIRALVRSEGVTALVATHDQSLISLADRVLEISDGVPARGRRCRSPDLPHTQHAETRRGHRDRGDPQRRRRTRPPGQRGGDGQAERPGGEGDQRVERAHPAQRLHGDPVGDDGLPQRDEQAETEHRHGVRHGHRPPVQRYGQRRQRRGVEGGAHRAPGQRAAVWQARGGEDSGEHADRAALHDDHPHRLPAPDGEQRAEGEEQTGAEVPDAVTHDADQEPGALPDLPPAPLSSECAPVGAAALAVRTPPRVNAEAAKRTPR